MAFHFVLPSEIKYPIESAIFRFYNTENSGNGLIELFAIENEWSEGTLSFEKLGDNLIKIGEKSCYGINIMQELDLTKFVNDILNGSKVNNGFYMHFKEPLNFFDPDSQRKTLFDCDTLRQWELNGTFEPSEIVAVNKAVFSANEYPNNLWGGLSGYTPGTTTGDIAWTKVADCLSREMKIFSSESENVDLRPELIIDDGVTSINNFYKNKIPLVDCYIESNSLYISSDYEKLRNIQLFNLKGQLLYCLKFTSNKKCFEIELKKFNESIIICKINSDSDRFLFKLINK